MRIVLIGLTAALTSAIGQAQERSSDSAALVRRLAAIAHLAAEEYRLGVVDGRVLQMGEVEEAKLFLAEARRTAALLPAPEAAPAVRDLEAIEVLVAAAAHPDSVAARVVGLVTGLGERLRVELDQIPAAPPSLARGAEVYQRVCASCHGVAGRGDGASAAGLNPRPADLSDAEFFKGATPLGFYRKITIGVAGTSMPPFEAALSVDDRWAAAAYASLFRLPSARGGAPPALIAFPATARMSDRQVLEALGPGADRSRVAAVRMVQVPAGAREFGAMFARVRRLLDSAYAMAAAGRVAEARGVAMDAYIAFEQVERDLAVKDAALVAKIEAAFAGVREHAGSAAAAPVLQQVRDQLARALERAERTIGDTLPPLELLVQAFLILLREGLEAILVIGALMAFVVRTGASHRRRDIHLGVAAAVGLSLLTALAIETVFRLSPSRQEVLEGATLGIATALLFYVSYWLLSRMEADRWNQFVRGKVVEAMGRRSAFALASVAFLAVYREGFETVLFYKALALAGGAGSGWAPIAGGIALGSLALAVIYVAVNRFGVRLPLKPFFAVTGCFLYVMAFSFAGQSVAELQEGGLLPFTPVPGGVRFPALGIYPTVESLVAQGVLVVLAVVALVWTFGVEPRRAARLRVPGPEAIEGAAAADSGGSQRAKSLLRSIDRIEADLAEVKAELGRMRTTAEAGKKVQSEQER